MKINLFLVSFGVFEFLGPLKLLQGLVIATLKTLGYFSALVFPASLGPHLIIKLKFEFLGFLNLILVIAMFENVGYLYAQLSFASFGPF